MEGQQAIRIGRGREFGIRLALARKRSVGSGETTALVSLK